MFTTPSVQSDAQLGLLHVSPSHNSFEIQKPLLQTQLPPLPPSQQAQAQPQQQSK